MKKPREEVEEGIEETKRRGRRGYWRNQEKRYKRVLEKPGEEVEESIGETRISKTILKIHTTLEYLGL